VRIESCSPSLRTPTRAPVRPAASESASASTHRVPSGRPREAGEFEDAAADSERAGHDRLRAVRVGPGSSRRAARKPNPQWRHAGAWSENPSRVDVEERSLHLGQM
jgi:hypothetical protein